MCHFPVWKRVKIGRFKIKGPIAYYQALKQKKVEINSEFSYLLAECEFAQEEKDVNLVKVSQEDLGLDPSTVTYRQFLNAAIYRGLVLPSAEVCAGLRLDYEEQGAERIYMATIPYARNPHGPTAFAIVTLVYVHGELYIGMAHCQMDYRFPAIRMDLHPKVDATKFIFMQPE